MDIYFILVQTHMVKYYLPLIIEANSFGINSNVILINKPGFNNSFDYEDDILELSKEYDFNVLKGIKCIPSKGIVFIMEYRGIDLLKGKNYVVVLTHMSDFKHGGYYSRYESNSKVKKIAMPGKYFAKIYEAESKKNMYYGSPKYDVKLNKQSIIDEYNLPEGKRALVIAPKKRDVEVINFPEIYRYLKRMGFTIIVKGRAKDRVPDYLKGDIFIEDVKWFPHPTMELIVACDLLVNCGSSTIKEAVMLEIPIVNLNTKPYKKTFSVLYDYDYCISLNNDYKCSDCGGLIELPESICGEIYTCECGHKESWIDILKCNISFEEFSNVVDEVMSRNLEPVFERVKKRYLWNCNNVSRKILLEVLNDYPRSNVRVIKGDQ